MGASVFSSPVCSNDLLSFQMTPGTDVVTPTWQLQSFLPLFVVTTCCRYS
ncbi:MAG: hypothetical protein ACRC8Y_21405 [Chroococcales cyanobacterium]